jgi:YesN/AraC family two-component response regulator
MEKYNVMTANGGPAALKLMAEHEFDVVITDLSMPGMHGFELIGRAKALQPFTAIIVLSGQGTFENAIEAVHRNA